MKDRRELAELLGYSAQSLTAIVYAIPAEAKYKIFEIPKKSGGKRIIKAPIPKLKKLQSHLSNTLYQCLSELDKDANQRPVSFGFRKKLSIFKNASQHKSRRWVLNIDLEDYFLSFNFGRVRGYFLKHKAFELEAQIATTIAQIACDESALPQGSPCSPVISEFICQALDARLVALAKKHRLTYSRYADDITFSTNKKIFPAQIAYPSKDDPSMWSISSKLLKEIERSGFSINKTKIRMQFRGSRQLVTGLVVNEKVNVQSEYYRNVRAMCASLFENGFYYKNKTASKDKTSEEFRSNIIRKLNPLEGMLRHIYTIKLLSDRRSESEQREYPTAIRKLYRKFLFYRYFINCESPLIVTEGKTDPVYLRKAFEARVDKFVQLGRRDSDSFYSSCSFFKYDGLAHEILGLYGGGATNLRSIPLDYRRFFNPPKDGPRSINHKPMRFPVIIVLDNDDGLPDLCSTLKKNFNVKISKETTEVFYHITENLYVVKVPENLPHNTCIEDLFPEVIVKTEIDGKKFTKNNKFDPKLYYGKDKFAHEVVARLPTDRGNFFVGFDGLLGRIVAVLDDYQIKKDA